VTCFYFYYAAAIEQNPSQKTTVCLSIVRLKILSGSSEKWFWYV